MRSWELTLLKMNGCPLLEAGKTGTVSAHEIHWQSYYRKPDLADCLDFRIHKLITIPGFSIQILKTKQNKKNPVYSKGLKLTSCPEPDPKQRALRAGSNPGQVVVAGQAAEEVGQACRPRGHLPQQGQWQ